MNLCDFSPRSLKSVLYCPRLFSSSQTLTSSTPSKNFSWTHIIIFQSENVNVKLNAIAKNIFATLKSIVELGMKLCNHISHQRNSTVNQVTSVNTGEKLQSSEKKEFNKLTTAIFCFDETTSKRKKLFVERREIWNLGRENVSFRTKALWKLTKAQETFAVHALLYLKLLFTLLTAFQVLFLLLVDLNNFWRINNTGNNVRAAVNQRTGQSLNCPTPWKRYSWQRTCKDYLWVCFRFRYWKSICQGKDSDKCKNLTKTKAN